MRLIQFTDARGMRRVGLLGSDAGQVEVVRNAASTRQVALAAIAAGHGLEEQVRALGLQGSVSYEAILAEARILVPMEAMTDSMRVFRWGLEGGRPAPGTAGVQSEWFYKGDGAILVHPGRDIPVPAFAEDAGEEPELTGLYVIGPDRKPYRLGYAIGNEFSDHIMERRSYLYLAHSKLRYCAFGPELRVGALPAALSGFSRIIRDGEVLWEKRFRTGPDNMSYTIENLEYHHFKYAQFLRPGDVHVYFFGSATASFSDGVATREGDIFEISLPGFGAPLRNGLRWVEASYLPGDTRQL